MDIIEKRIDNLQLLFIDGSISAEEYSKLRSKFISDQETQKGIIHGIKGDSKELADGIKDSINLFNNFSKAMKAMDLEDRFQIWSSIFTEKLKFDGKNCRTHKINEAVALLLSIDGGSGGNKKRDKLKNLNLSLQVDPESVSVDSERLSQTSINQG